METAIVYWIPTGVYSGCVLIIEMFGGAVGGGGGGDK